VGGQQFTVFQQMALRLGLAVHPHIGALLLGGIGLDAHRVAANAVFQRVVKRRFAVQIHIAEDGDQRFDQVGFAGAVLADQRVTADGFGLRLHWRTRSRLQVRVESNIEVAQITESRDADALQLHIRRSPRRLAFRAFRRRPVPESSRGPPRLSVARKRHRSRRRSAAINPWRSSRRGDGRGWWPAAPGL